METFIDRYFEQGVQQGIQQGIQQGLQQGLQQGTCEVLSKLLHRRFGELPGWARERLIAADQATLDAWAEEIFDASSIRRSY